MTIQIHLNVSPNFELNNSQLVEAAEVSLQQAQRSVGELSIKLTDDATMRKVHQEYLAEDSTTDVLSFPHGDINPDSGLPYFGDILISVPQAEKQAESAGHPLQSELILLIVHGVLHLLGYDHREFEDQRQMWHLQRQILDTLGVTVEVPETHGN